MNLRSSLSERANAARNVERGTGDFHAIGNRIENGAHAGTGMKDDKIAIRSVSISPSTSSQSHESEVRRAIRRPRREGKSGRAAEGFALPALSQGNQLRFFTRDK
jgi:hypothetical protein